MKIISRRATTPLLFAHKAHLIIRAHRSRMDATLATRGYFPDTAMLEPIHGRTKCTLCYFEVTLARCYRHYSQLFTGFAEKAATCQEILTCLSPTGQQLDSSPVTATTCHEILPCLSPSGQQLDSSTGGGAPVRRSFPAYPSQGNGLIAPPLVGDPSSLVPHRTTT